MRGNDRVKSGSEYGVGPGRRAWGRPGRLLMLERLINYIRSHPNVEFMRMGDVAGLWG